eukprot:scaffold2415_cov111-Isochrysis_galbana.AAC.4
MISVEKNETISVKPKKTQSNRKNAVEHAGDARSQTKRTPNLRRKKRQIAVDSSEILHNWTAILRFVENSTEILLSGHPYLLDRWPARPAEDRGIGRPTLMSPGTPAVLLAFTTVLLALTTGVGAFRPARPLSRRQVLCTGATCAAAVASACTESALAVEEADSSAVLNAGSVFAVIPDGARLRPSLSMLGTSRALNSLCSPGVNAVFLGEHHNAAQDHALQTALLTEMRRRQPTREMAVGLEAVQRRFQPALDAYTGACVAACPARVLPPHRVCLIGLRRCLRWPTQRARCRSASSGRRPTGIADGRGRIPLRELPAPLIPQVAGTIRVLLGPRRSAAAPPLLRRMRGGCTSHAPSLLPASADTPAVPLRWTVALAAIRPFPAPPLPPMPRPTADGYAPVFDAAKQAGMRLLALNVDSEDLALVWRRDLAPTPPKSTFPSTGSPASAAPACARHAPLPPQGLSQRSALFPLPQSSAHPPQVEAGGFPNLPPDRLSLYIPSATGFGRYSRTVAFKVCGGRFSIWGSCYPRTVTFKVCGSSSPFGDGSFSVWDGSWPVDLDTIGRSKQLAGPACTFSVTRHSGGGAALLRSAFSRPLRL